MLIAPVLIIIGIFMLDIIKLNIPKVNIGGEGLKKKTKGSWGAMLLGVLFALAFCPTSGVFYFGMLMPLAAAETRRVSFTCNLCYCYGTTCNPCCLDIGVQCCRIRQVL